jgi:hypothetical protein
MLDVIRRSYSGGEVKRTDSSSTTDEEQKLCRNNSNVHLSNSNSENESSQTQWIPPKEHGLSNSLSIIPSYYIDSHSSFVNIDYYDIIVDDIRNMRKLNSYQMKYIKEELDEDQKNHLLDIFNDVLDSIGSWF